jgi:hypothetical protein
VAAPADLSSSRSRAGSSDASPRPFEPDSPPQLDTLRARRGRASVVRARTILALVLLALGLSGVEAQAANCGLICHGVADWDNPVDKWGAISYIRVGPFNVTETCDDAAYAPLWVDTPVGGVEHGYRYGKRTYQSICTGLEWYFVAANESSYVIDYPWIGVEYNADYAVKTNWVGGGMYWMYVNGIYVAEARGQQGPVVALSTGLEMHGDGPADLYMVGHSLQKRGQGGTSWSYNWPDAQIRIRHGASAWWCTWYSCMEARIYP